MHRTLPGRWKCPLLSFLLVACGCAGAGSQTLDSMRHALAMHKAEDTTKVNLYSQVASEYRNASTDSMIAVARRGLALADRIHYSRGKARVLASLGVAYMFRNELDKADSICNKAVAILEQTKDSTGMGPVFYYLGNIRYRQTKYKEAVSYFEKTVQFAELTHDYKSVAKSLDNIGTSYVVLGKNTEALNHFLKALKIWERIDNIQGRSNCLSNLSRLYVTLGDKEKALKYINESIAVQKTGYVDVQAIVHSYMNAVSIYTALNNDSAAIAACTYAINVADSAGQRSEMAVMLVDRGMSYFHAKEYDKAFADYARCLEPGKEKITPAMEGQANIGLGEVWLARGNAAKSIPHLLKAYAIFRENGMDDQTGPAAEELGTAYEQVGDYKQSLKYTRIGHALKDSLFNEENTERQQQLQFDYELEKKQNQIQLLERDKQIVQERSDRQRATVAGLLAGLALAIVFAVQFYRGRLREKKSRETIAMQAGNLEELNRFKDKVFSVLSHDLRGPIGSIAATVDLLEANVISPEEQALLQPEMKKQLGSLTFLLDNLLKWSKNHMAGVTQAQPEYIDVYKITQQNITLLSGSARDKNIKVRNDIPKQCTVYADPGHVDIILRNLLSNAIKFTKPGGTVTVSATSEGDATHISVNDDGVGMTPQQVSGLFKAATHTTTYGTAGEKGTGLGLLLSYEFAKANNGEILVASEENKGSRFSLVLPAMENGKTREQAA